MTAIFVERLVKAYGDSLVLRDVCFSVSPGDTVALLGPNGAGKTTTLEILEGFRRRDDGEVRVLGEDPGCASRDWRERIGVVLQQSRHDPFLTVGETVDLVRGWYREPLDTADVLGLVALTEAAGHRVAKLSGGQQRRLDVALGLVGRPELLFLDEPTTGFDPAARREAWGALRRLRERGTTVLLTTHYLDEASALADRLVVLAGGRVIADGPPTAIGERDQTHVISFRPGTHLLHDLPPGGELHEGRWTTTVPDVTPTVHTLSSWARERGAELHDLEIARSSLEDVYLRLIS